jgi:hypothetical protein
VADLASLANALCLAGYVGSLAVSAISGKIAHFSEDDREDSE